MGPESAPEIRYCSECGQPALADELASFGGHMVCPNCKNNYVQRLREGVAPAPAGMQYAGFWIRFLAAIIDGVVLAVVDTIVAFAVLRPLGFQQIQPGSTPAEVFGALGAVGVVWLVDTLIASCYEALFVSRLGATPGKMALSLKVVRADGGPVSLGRAFGRYFCKVLSMIILCIGYIMAGFDSQKRALHDMICDTRVIKQDA